VDLTWLPLGVVGRAHGVRGEGVLHLFNPKGWKPDATQLPCSVLLTDSSRSREVQLVGFRTSGRLALIKLLEVDSPEALAALVGARLCLPRALLPPLSTNEFYVADFIDSEVFSIRGQSLGRVVDSFWNGNHDVLRVLGEDGREVFLPAVGDFLVRFEPSARRLTVDLHE
jgi:16S rRNA processing protein RimM